jgi:glutamate racemase
MKPLKKEHSSRKTILVTDSGLGGMSVFAQIAAHLTKKSPWQDVSMIYFNAWPEQNGGYNHFKTMEQRAVVFNNALNVMENFKPDIILIACNTLSVIYPFTHFSQNTKSQVFGIVDHGVQLIYENLMEDPDSHVIIFGTPTTIAEKSHEKKLVKMGINPDRVIGKGCINLAGKIERDPFSSSVKQMIHKNVLEAVTKIHKPTQKIYAALCCTHFGYRMDLFQQALSENIKESITMLNPNQRMADHVMKNPSMEKRSIKTRDHSTVFSPDIDMHIVSKVCWEKERIDAYSRLLKPVSSDVVKALAAYEWNPDLFEI